MFKVVVLVAFVTEYANFDLYKSFEATNKDFLCSKGYSRFFCVGSFRVTTLIGFCLFYFIITVTAGREWEA